MSKDRIVDASGITRYHENLKPLLPKELVIDVYPDTETGITIPSYFKSEDEYKQNGFYVIPEAETLAELEEWYSRDVRQVTYKLDASAAEMVTGGVFGNIGSLELTTCHYMELPSGDGEVLAAYTSFLMGGYSFDCYGLVTRNDVGEGDMPFTFSFEYKPVVPITIEVTENADGTYTTAMVSTQTAEYWERYITNGGRQIICIMKNTEGVEMSRILYDAEVALLADGTPAGLVATSPSLTDGDVEQTIVAVTYAGGSGCIKKVAPSEDAVKSIANPIVISFPYDVTPENEVGLQGEVTHVYETSSDDFYSTIGCASGTSCADYYAMLKSHLVLVSGGPGGNPTIIAPFVQMTGDNEITVTCHAHFWTGGMDGVVTNSVADMVCVFDFEQNVASFALTQWNYDEAHMAAPHRIGIVIDASTIDGDLIIDMQLTNGRGESVTSKYVLDLMKSGMRVTFGSLDASGVWSGVNGEYDIWAFSDTQIALRWANLSKGKSVGTSYYYSHSYSIMVFDASGHLKYNDTKDLPISGYAYNYKPVQATAGDEYVSSSIVDSSVDNATHTLQVKANTISIADAGDRSDYAVKMTCTSTSTGTISLSRTYALDNTYPLHPICWTVDGTSTRWYTDSEIAKDATSCTIYSVTITSAADEADGIGKTRWTPVNVTISSTTAGERKDGLVTAIDVKKYLNSNLASSSYYLELTDEGSLRCMNDALGDGFDLDDDGSLEIA